MDEATRCKFYTQIDYIKLFADKIWKFLPPPCCGITVSHAVQFRKLECWRSHYQNTLNHPPASQCPDLDSDAARAVPDLTVPDDAPTLGEVRHAIRKLKNGRAAGSDGIQPELLKYAEEPVSISLHSQFARVWKTGLVPAEWSEGIIVSTVAVIARSLLSVPGKVFANVLLARLQPSDISTPP